MAASAVPVKVTAEQLGLEDRNEVDGHLEYDLGNMAVFDPSPLDTKAFIDSPDDSCLQIAQTLAQALVAKLFGLPCEAVVGGRVAHLPAPTTRLPREKPIPKPAPLTKWQKFALQKGIKKRKRSTLEFDENSQEWKRRHGYKRANDEGAVPIIEARATDQPGEDPFTALDREKRERGKRQLKQQTDNVKKSVKSGATLPPTLQLSASLPERGKGKPTKRKELKGEIASASSLAGVATASMGKFDRRLSGEKEERRLPGKKRQRSSVTDTDTERTKLMSFTDKFIRERSDDILDVKKAIGKIEAGVREDRHAANVEGGEHTTKKRGGKGGFKGKGGGGKGGGGKGRGGDGGAKGGRGGDGGKGGKGKGSKRGRPTASPGGSGRKSPGGGGQKGNKRARR